MNKRLISCLFIITCLATRADAADTLLYNNKYAVACHNCYERKYSSSLAEALLYTSTIELDIWDSRYFVGKKKCAGSDWYVKHSLFQKGNNNCAGGSLRVCLSEIAEWTKQNPEHEVLTIYIDKKEGWGSSRSGRQPADLDKLITSIFPADKIYSPKEVLQENQSLKNAVHDCNWPTTTELKGKVIFVITDATILKCRNKLLNQYLDKRQDNSLCFVAPLIKKESEVQKPRGVCKRNESNIVFYNLRYKNVGLSTLISSHNYINRVYNSPETLSTVSTLEAEKVNFIALHNYKLSSSK